MWRFNIGYFIASIFLFCVEVLIAIYAHDDIIRPFIGDLLVVILLYCMVKSVIQTGVFIPAIAVLLFSYLIETLQYFQIVHLLGLDDSKLANIIIGNSFAWMDILMYSLGIAIVLLVEIGIRNKPAYLKINKT
ncbi:MAG: DUF2809 domain-containing protein [Pelobium sp.]